MPRKSGVPSYRKRTINGHAVAVVTLPDQKTGRRRDHWLGRYGSPEGREKYARLIVAWETAGRRLPPRLDQRAGYTLTVAQLAWSFLQHMEDRYSPRELDGYRQAIRVLRGLYGETPAADFGPNALRTVREAMIRGDDKADPPRPAWSRQTVNRRIHRVRATFKWAASYEMLHVGVYQALCTVEGLRRGQSGARETEPVGCAPEAAIAAVKAIVSRQVAAMIDLQLLTGMRPGEVVIMRPRDLDMSGKVWLYRPEHHKTEHHGKARTVYLGPRAQDAIRPFLVGRSVAAPLFSPAEAEAERRARLHEVRKTPAGQGNEPGTNRVESPRVRPADQYSVDSYRRSIGRACDLAVVPAWHPHQLRHNYATMIRKTHGLEAAQILLGHSSAAVTDAVYAERDEGKALAIAAAVG